MSILSFAYTVHDANRLLVAQDGEIYGEEPGKRDHPDHAELAKARVQLGELVSNERLKHALVDQRTHDFGVVIVWQEALTHRHKQPKRVLLAAIDQEHGGNYVHRLAITYLRVTEIKWM